MVKLIVSNIPFSRRQRLDALAVAWADDTADLGVRVRRRKSIVSDLMERASIVRLKLRRIVGQRQSLGFEMGEFFWPEPEVEGDRQASACPVHVAEQEGSIFVINLVSRESHGAQEGA